MVLPRTVTIYSHFSTGTRLNVIWPGAVVLDRNATRASGCTGRYGHEREICQNPAKTPLALVAFLTRT
eukprot:scaffold189512_cov17-Prasinocladus_malaysianus.AAC.1